MLIGAALAALILGTAVGFAWWSSRDTTDADFLLACDEAIKDRVLSPASYIRASATGPLWQANEVGGEKLVSVIEYDAANAFGTLLRGISICDVDGVLGRKLTVPIQPRIDGVTSVEWYLKQARRSLDEASAFAGQ